jgi:hypothetical protein
MDQLLPSIQQQSFLEWTHTSLEQSLPEFCTILLEEHFEVADRTLEIVALDTPNNMAVFVTDAPGKRPPTICPLLHSDKAPIFRLFHTDCHSTQSLIH